MINPRRFSWLNWIVLGIFSIITAATLGMSLGYIQETNKVREQMLISSAVALKTQYDLGKLDYEAGRFQIALQRFEYILANDRDYPGALELLTKTMLAIKTNEEGQREQPQIPTVSPTATLSPTPDTRDIEEVFITAMGLYENRDWINLVQTLLALRDRDPMYRVGEVDRMMYLSHYFNGIDKILVQGDLEGGLYDLSLAELFTQLDSQADVYREWARLYQIGMSFWYVYPDQSVFYFRQLAAAAPYLRDLSGITAIQRYKMALLMYGETLADSKNWCEAAEQFNLAQEISYDAGIETRVQEINEQCQYSIATPTPTPSLTFTPSATPSAVLITQTGTLTPSNTATLTISLTAILTFTPGPTQTNTQTSTYTSTPGATTPSPTGTTRTATSTPTPTTANTPTSTNTSTSTPMPEATNTAENPTATQTPTPSQTPEP